MSVWVVAEQEREILSRGTEAAITAANQLSDQITVLVIGHQCGSVVQQAAQKKGVRQVIVADHAHYQHPLAESYAPLIAEVTVGATHLLAPASSFGKNLMPRVAALLKVGQVSDIVAIHGHDTYDRPLYAGNVIATVRSLDPIQVLTVRPTAFQISSEVQSPCEIKAITPLFESHLSAWISNEIHETSRPALSSAKCVVSGGRGLKNKENFARLEKIADHLSAAVGASRAAVDAGLAPNDWQVGQTGQIVAPSLYFAVGISGAIQHLAGMKDSRVVVAINKDPEAPIFKVADYGLIADIETLLPEWEAILSKD